VNGRRVAPFEVSDNSRLMLALGLGWLASRRGAYLATAESCTGGLASSWMTAVSGSSRWFEGSVVSYSNGVKMQLLGVRAETLRANGAVSTQVAEEMVLGLARISGDRIVDAGVSLTGVAGPGGGSPDKPVGTVCFAWMHGDGRAYSSRQCFSGSRNQIQLQAAWWGLAGLFALLSRGLVEGQRGPS